jgi:peptide deformylase
MSTALLPASVRLVLRAPDPGLRIAGAPVDPADPVVVRLVADLAATMRRSPGCVGLAAPQIGVPVHVFVVDVTGHPKTVTCHGFLALCNARVVDASQWRPGREGCLSVPDLTGDVRRARRVVVAGELPGSGDTVNVRTDAYEARALQHELDHCSGLLFLDRVRDAAAVHSRKVFLPDMASTNSPVHAGSPLGV